MASIASASGASAMSDVGDILALERVHEGHLGLVGQEPERSERLLVVGRELERGDGLAFFEGRLHDLDDFELLECLLAVGPGFLDAGFQALDAAGDDAQVGEQQLIAKRRELGCRVASGESVQDDQQGVPFADQGEALGVVGVRARQAGRACPETRLWRASLSSACGVWPGSPAAGRKAWRLPPARHGSCEGRDVFP